MHINVVNNMNEMNNPLAEEKHSSTAAEALSLLLGIRYSSNQVFTQLHAQDSEIFHNNIKLTSNDLYIVCQECRDLNWRHSVFDLVFRFARNFCPSSVPDLLMMGMLPSISVSYSHKSRLMFSLIHN